MNEPIKVIVQDETGTEKITGAGGGNTGQQTSLLNQQSENNKNKGVAQTIGTLVAMRTVTYATSNVGKWLGNSRYQQAVDVGQKALGYGVAFAANVYVGIATVALDAVTSVADVAFNNYWDDLKTRNLQQKLGGKGGYRR